MKKGKTKGKKEKHGNTLKKKTNFFLNEKIDKRKKEGPMEYPTPETAQQIDFLHWSFNMKSWGNRGKKRFWAQEKKEQEETKMKKWKNNARTCSKVLETWKKHERNMKETWKTHERHMKETWKTHERHMKDTWKTHERHMKDTWKKHERNMKETWKKHERNMKETWMKHERNMKETWMKHEWTWMNMNEHEWTWMNMNENEWKRMKKEWKKNENDRNWNKMKK